MSKNLIIVLLAIVCVGLFLNRKLDKIEFENRQRVAHVPVEIAPPTAQAAALAPPQDVVPIEKKSPDVDIVFNQPPPSPPGPQPAPPPIEQSVQIVPTNSPNQMPQITMATPQIINETSSRYGAFAPSGQIGVKSVSVELATVYSATKTILISLGVWNFLRAALSIVSVLSIVFTILRYLKS